MQFKSTWRFQRKIATYSFPISWSPSISDCALDSLSGRQDDSFVRCTCYHGPWKTELPTTSWWCSREPPSSARLPSARGTRKGTLIIAIRGAAFLYQLCTATLAFTRDGASDQWQNVLKSSLHCRQRSWSYCFVFQAIATCYHLWVRAVPSKHTHLGSACLSTCHMSRLRN